MDASTRAFFDALHRGGAYHVLTHLPSLKSEWRPTSEPLPDVTGQKDWYFGVYPTTCIPDRNGTGKHRAPSDVRTQARYVASMPCLYGDFDGKAYATKADPDLDRGMARALQHILALPVQPSAIVPSGGGFHAYWMLCEPWLMQSDADRAEAAAILARWVAFVGADEGAKDLARVLRVPGTLNAKPEYGTPRQVGPLEYHPERVYRLADLVALLPPPAPAKPTPAPAPAGAPAGKAGGGMGPAYWLEKYKAEAAEGVKGRHNCALAMVLQFRAEGMPEDEAERWLLDFAAYCETLGPCQEPAEVNFHKVLDTVYSWPTFSMEPARPYTPEEPEWLDDAPDAAEYTLDASRSAGLSGAIRATDVGNARRLVARHGADLCYCERLGGWYVWDGRRWAVDETGEVERRAKDTVNAMFAEAAHLEGDDRTRAMKHAMGSESARAIHAMIELAQTEPGIAARPDAFDCDPWLLNVTNGTLDLRTGKLRAHDRGDLLTKLAPVTYDPDATHPTLDRYLSDATGGDADFSTYLQRAAGYSLTGSTAEECFFLMLGPAATGKSTLLEAMLALLGDYGVKAAFEAFLEQRGVVTERATPERARLRGARLVAASETSKSRQLNEALVKQFTGGETVTARDLYAAPFTFFPTFKLWLAANEAPKLTDTDTGLWRRLQRLPFEHAVPEGKRDPKVKQAMTGEALPALLAWAVRGCLAWQAGGLRMAPAVRAATVQLRAEFDPLVEFFAECCVFEHHAETPARELREAYVSWASSMGARPINNAEWSARLTAKGCQSIRTRRGGAQMTCWQGVGLLSDDDPAGATVEGVQYVHK